MGTITIELTRKQWREVLAAAARGTELLYDSADEFERLGEKAEASVDNREANRLSKFTRLLQARLGL